MPLRRKARGRGGDFSSGLSVMGVLVVERGFYCCSGLGLPEFSRADAPSFQFCFQRHGRTEREGEEGMVSMEMTNNGNSAEDNVASADDARELGINGKGKRMSAIIGRRGEEE